jgi:hypothetical protein
MLSRAILFAALLPVGGDSIGPHPSYTSDKGGFSLYSGTPAKQVTILGEASINKIEAVVFGEFNPSSFQVPVWTLASYIASAPPDNYAHIINSSAIDWGNSGLAGGNLPTKLVTLEVAYDLEQGTYVIGLSSSSQKAKLAGTSLETELLSTYERLNVTPRAYLPPHLSWAVNLFAEYPADFNQDYLVDLLDFHAWKAGFGPTYSGSDLLAWQRGASYNPIPEPYAFMALWFLISLFLTYRTRNNGWVSE